MKKHQAPPTPTTRHLGFVPVESLTGGKIHLMSVGAWEGSSTFPAALCGNRANNNGWSVIPINADTPASKICPRSLKRAQDEAAKKGKA